MNNEKLMEYILKQENKIKKEIESRKANIGALKKKVKGN